MMRALSNDGGERPMKIFLSVCVMLAMALTNVALRAADVSGSWTAQMTTPSGDNFQISFTFKQAGGKLTGTVQGPQGDPIQISDGTVDGNKLSFNVSFNGMTISHEGSVNDSGDEIELTTKSDQPDFSGGEMTLKRNKPAPVGRHVPARPPAPQP